ncbi:MAG: SCO family protein [Deltaproteobacteria bacterium]|nr:SCO family protein [Deltaproteobacteria bacterium]
MDDLALSERHAITARRLFFGWLVVTAFFWGFAFYRAPVASSDWLLRAQSACFGTSETGLPDTYGWMVLILAPSSFLVAILVAIGSDLYRGLRGVSSNGIIAKVFYGFVAVLISVEAIWVAGRVQEGLGIAEASFTSTNAEGLPEFYPRSRNEAPEFLLIDQFGKEVSLASMNGKAAILTFAFAHCQTICPALVSSTKAALASLPAEETVLLIVTLDPWRDTPTSLPSLAKKWDLAPNAHVMSGEVEKVNGVIESYKIPTERDEKTGDVVHPGLVFILSPDGKIAYTFNNPSSRWISDAVSAVLQKP